MGLTSRAGVIPLSMLADIAGPMARTVEDATRIFQVIAGEDPDDPVTAAARAHPIPNYLASLDPNGLKGAVIGVLRQAYERDSTDPEITRIFMKAVEDLKRAGATIVDPATVELGNGGRGGRGGGGCQGFKYDLNQYLASQGDKVPVKSLADVLRSRGYHPSVQLRLEQADKGAENGPDSPACAADRAYRDQVREAVMKSMEKYKLDAFVYPTWSNVPRLIGDLNTPAGDNSQFYSPTTGFPAINVPMGFSRGGTLPAGMTFFGKAWSEAALIKYAYAYEQLTKHRRPPASTPPLR
jgi:Asp-tRNA(Asn)/Glu-tRNA(Gln) amidotransferase A subunit family amidase